MVGSTKAGALLQGDGDGRDIGWGHRGMEVPTPQRWRVEHLTA